MFKIRTVVTKELKFGTHVRINKLNLYAKFQFFIKPFADKK